MVNVVKALPTLTDDVPPSRDKKLSSDSTIRPPRLF